jgi:uncharacterized protein (DUF1778 family)
MFLYYNFDMKAKIGRPRKAPEESLTEIIPIRLTRAEREQCERAAAQAQRKLTAWIRERAVKAARREAKSG